jgi:putative hydrolase of the HAD superfamily
MSFAFFDLDDTLVDTATALRTWSADFVHDHGLGGAEAVAELVRHRVRDAATWREFVAHLPEWYGIEVDAHEMYERIIADYPAKFTLDPAVAAGLVRLRETGWQLGIVTNGATRVQQAKIDRVGLRSHVDMVLDSETAGYAKPDARIFEIAAEKLGVELAPDGWMVGDMLDKDIEGGLAAGLRTIWLPHGRPLPADGPQPTHVVDGMAAALELIAAHGG